MYKARVICLFGLAAALAACSTHKTRHDQYDVVLRGGTIYDGTGAPAFVGDVAIQDDRIVRIGKLGAVSASLDIDASGLAVAPGFINMLSWGVKSLLVDGRALSDITQGVTLEVFGEGFSMGPLPPHHEALASRLFDNIDIEVDWRTLGEYLERLERQGVATNVASFVGATTVRIHEIGFEDRPPTPEELDRMRALVREAMAEGAMGLGTSLIYPPAFYADTKELIELAKVAGEFGGMYVSHLRSEANQLLEAIDELITVAREAGIAAEIYHLKLAGEQNWPKLDAVIETIELARAAGIAISANMYVYGAGATDLSATMPPWAQEGGREAFLRRLRDPDTRARVVEEMAMRTDQWENMYQLVGPEGILLVGERTDPRSPSPPRTLAEVAAERGKDARDVAVDLLLENPTGVTAAYFLASEENIVRQIKLPWVSFGSDGDARAADTPVGIGGEHPRSYGNVPRLLGRYVRDQKVIPLTEAIRRLTSLPASNLKIANRGQLKSGYFADITVFDPAQIRDHATFSDPHRLSTGVTHVFVNGKQVLAHGEYTGAKPGRVVRGPGWTGRPAAGSAVADSDR